VRRVAIALKERKKPAALVLNKVDKLKDKTPLPAMAQELHGLCDFDGGFMISATRGDGVKDIIKFLSSRMPEGPWLYADDQVTDTSERDIATEVTREQCFLRVHEELPYGLMVEHETWEEHTKNGKRSIKIRQAIIVARESHKKILLGKSGIMLRAIGISARKIIGETLGADVHLFLFVKVRETWKEEAEMFHKAGLEYKG
jgi:GTPase